jgi:hypothetical protein
MREWGGLRYSEIGKTMRKWGELCGNGVNYFEMGGTTREWGELFRNGINYAGTERTVRKWGELRRDGEKHAEMGRTMREWGALGRVLPLPRIGETGKAQSETGRGGSGGGLLSGAGGDGDAQAHPPQAPAGCEAAAGSPAAHEGPMWVPCDPEARPDRRA